MFSTEALDQDIADMRDRYNAWQAGQVCAECEDRACSGCPTPSAE